MNETINETIATDNKEEKEEKKMENEKAVTKEERAEIITNIKELLNEYNYEWRTYGIEEIVDTWIANKSSIIRHFKKHPNYVPGKFMIAIESKSERACDPETVKKFWEWLMFQVVNREENIDLLNEDVNARRLQQGCRVLPSEMYSWFAHERDYGGITSQFIGDYSEDIKAVFGLSVSPTTKTSRVINKIMTYVGYNKHPDYNKEFAKYSDALNPLVVENEVVISVNPIDYLTMSFGNSWASCHTIDKSNKRNMPNTYSGMYSSGTLSYMLDGSSIITYTPNIGHLHTGNFDGNADDYFRFEKIDRQMFHIGEHKIVQARMYPQANDSAKEVYKPRREIVQKVIADIYDLPNFWNVKSGCYNASEFIESEGTHYRDYENFESCNVSIHKDFIDDENCFTVGHDPVCPNCGRQHGQGESILCYDCDGDSYRCTGCGDRVSEDDVIWADGMPYCNDCVTYCYHCEEYVRNTDATYLERYNRYVCSECLEELYTRCSNCGEWVRDCDISVTANDHNICDDCREEYYAECENCEDLFETDEMIIAVDDDSDERYYCQDCAPDKCVVCPSTGVVMFAGNKENRCSCSSCVGKTGDWPRRYVAHNRSLEETYKMIPLCCGNNKNDDSDESHED